MFSPTTQLIHHPYTPPSGFEAPQPGVFKASTVIFPTVAAMRERKWKDKSAFTYGLHGTPTTYQLEERLCSLEGGLYCVLVPSGLAAIANVALAMLKSGDSMLLPNNVYGPNQAFADGQLARWGISTAVYDAMAGASSAAPSPAGRAPRRSSPATQENLRGSRSRPSARAARAASGA